MGSSLGQGMGSPDTKGTLGGRYLPSMQWIDSGIGTVLYWGKSVMSSGVVWVRTEGGFRILGAGIQGSFRCAYPSHSTDATCLYFAAFLRMDAIQQFNIYIMTAYERLAARRQNLKNLPPEFTSQSQRSELRLQVNQNLFSNKKPSSLNLVPKQDQPTPNIFHLPPTPADKHSVKFLQEDVQLKTKKQDQKRKTISFEDYNTLDHNPLGKRDGLEVRGEELSLKQNINYLLGMGEVRSNAGRWRIIEIGEVVEENNITYSGMLLGVWEFLPKWFTMNGKLYWLLAVILNFIVSSKKSAGWLLAIYLITLVVEIGLRFAQINGKRAEAKKGDQRKCQKYSALDKKWVEIDEDKLTSGDIIKLQPLDPFPCDCLLMQCSGSRLVSVNQQSLRGKYSQLMMKETLFATQKEVPFSGMVYLLADVENSTMNQWEGYIKLKDQFFTISYRNFGHRGTINNDSVELVCIVMYTMGNQKVLEEVGFPHIFKEKNLEKKFNKFVWALSVAALICAGIEAAVNFGFASVVPSTSYLRISPSAITSLQALAKYISQFTVIIPIFSHIIYLLFGLLWKLLVQKDPFFQSQLSLLDSQSLHQLAQTKLLISPLSTLLNKPHPKLLQVKVKQITYTIGEDIDFIRPGDVEMIMDFLSAAFLTCQEMEESTQKTAILQSGKKFGMTRDFNSNTVRLREDSQYLMGELLKEIPRVEGRPFGLTFYRESKNNRILCLIRGSSEFIISRIYSRESEIAKLIRRIQQQNLCPTQLVGKVTVSFLQFQNFVQATQTGPLFKLYELSIQLLKNAQILGVLVYENTFIDESSRLFQAIHGAGVGNLVLCDKVAQKDALLRHLRLEFEEVTFENIDNEVLNIGEQEKLEAKVLEGQTITKCKEENKLESLAKLFQGNHCTLLVKYTPEQLKQLLKLLKQKQIVTAGLAQTQSSLALLKFTDVGIAINDTQHYYDLLRYSDIKVKDLRQFLKLFLVHSRNNYFATAKLFLFLIQKSLMIFFCELIYSFYTLCTDVVLMPVLCHYLLEVWLLCLPPLVFYLFEGDYEYNVMVKNTHLMKKCNEGNLFSWWELTKRAFTVLLQSAVIVFVVLYSLQDPIDSTGTMKGHQITGFLIFFCIFHCCLFKMSISGEQHTWPQTLTILLSILLFYATSAVFSSSSLASITSIELRNIMPAAFSGRGFLIGVVVVYEVGLIDFMLMVRGRVFTKTLLRRPEKVKEEGSQQELVVYGLPN